MGQPRAITDRERLERRRAETLASIKRAGEMVYRGHRDDAWLVGVDAELNAELQAIDAELVAFVDVPIAADLTPYLAALDRISDAFALYPDAAKRDILAAIGTVVYERGRVTIRYHDEYAYLFPEPTIVSARYHPGKHGWEIEVVAE